MVFFRMSSYGYSVVHRKDLHLTRIVVTIVLVFLVLNLPRLVLGVFEISRLDRIGDEQGGIFMGILAS